MDSQIFSQNVKRYLFEIDWSRQVGDTMFVAVILRTSSRSRRLAYVCVCVCLKDYILKSSFIYTHIHPHSSKDDADYYRGENDLITRYILCIYSYIRVVYIIVTALPYIKSSYSVKHHKIILLSFAFYHVWKLDSIPCGAKVYFNNYIHIDRQSAQNFYARRKLNFNCTIK